MTNGIGSEKTPPLADFPVRSPNETVGRDIATLNVAGYNFRDWETVWVQLRANESFSYFRFTAVERDTPPGLFYKLQFVPGEPCKINLGGIDVIRGIIETRQVGYDANRHGVELQGKSLTAWPARSSVNTKTGSFDGMTFEQVARKVLSEYPVGVKVVGNLNNQPFEKLQNQPGEMIWDFLERIARPRGIVLGTDSFNNFLLIDNHTKPVLNTELIEGQNIKSMQCVMHKEALYTEYKVIGQTSGNDQSFGSSNNELEGSWGGSSPAKALLITPAEQPVKSIQEIIDRAKNEAIWHEYMQVECTVVVQGWFRDNETLWWPLDNVFVHSPMCPLSQVMKIQHVTFEQNNNGGTFTTLDLVQPWALKDIGQFNPTNNPNIPSAPTAVPPGQNIPPV